MNYVGIDVHKVHSQICIQDESGAILQELRIKTSRERFAEVLGGKPCMRLLLESSCESEWVARCLESLGHVVIVANPSYAIMYGTRSRHVKTDLRDARALADACRLGAYKPAHRASEDRRHAKRRLRVRDALVRSRAALVTLVQALLRQDGIRVPTGGVEKFCARVRTLDLPGRLMSEIAPVLAQLEPLNEQIKYCDRVVDRMSEEDDVAARLQSTPCVGPVTALAFVTTIDRVDRFNNAHQVESYLGLVPREMSSGERQHRGHITKAGDSYVRMLLVQAAVRILRVKPAEATPLWEWAKRIEARRGTHVARVALARRLAGILFAMMRDRSSFLLPRLAPAAVA